MRYMCAMFVHSLPPIILRTLENSFGDIFLLMLAPMLEMFLGMTRSPRVYSTSETSNQDHNKVKGQIRAFSY